MSACLKKATLQAFVDSELPPVELASAERHIATCASCQQELDGIRATTLKVGALLDSLAPDDGLNTAPIAVVRIPYDGANSRMRWTVVTSAGVFVATLFLFVMIWRQHSPTATNVVKSMTPAFVPSVEKKEVLVAAVTKPAQVGTSKPRVKVRQFQALDDGEPMQTGMIYRVNLPATASPGASASQVQSAKRIPAEVIVDEFGNVRAIRFLQ
jgi:hypothetical protein